MSVANSGVAGRATLTPQADGTIQIRVEAYGVKNGTPYFSSASNRTAQDCQGGLIGSFSSSQTFTHPIPQQRGQVIITYTVPGPLSDIFSVSIREGAAQPGTVVACGEFDARDRLVLPLGPVGGSTVVGKAELRTEGNMVRIELVAYGVRNGTSYFSGAFNSTSQNCVGGLIGSFAAPVTAENGQVLIGYNVPGPIQNISAVSVNQGTQTPGTVVACGRFTNR